VSGFPLTVQMLFSDRDMQIKFLTALNLALAGGAVFLCLLLFLHPAMAFITACHVAMIDVNLFGLMLLWNIPWDVPSFITLAMAVGLSVDYCSHIGVSYYNQKGLPKEMVCGALGEVGTSIISGGISTLLGLCVLAFPQSEPFLIFFKMLFAIVLFGLLHGLILFPVVLSLIPTVLMGAVAKDYMQLKEKNALNVIIT